jgi:hypothetical protein
MDTKTPQRYEDAHSLRIGRELHVDLRLPFSSPYILMKISFI